MSEGAFLRPVFTKLRDFAPRGKQDTATTLSLSSASYLPGKMTFLLGTGFQILTADLMKVNFTGLGPDRWWAVLTSTLRSSLRSVPSGLGTLGETHRAGVRGVQQLEPAGAAVPSETAPGSRTPGLAHRPAHCQEETLGSLQISLLCGQRMRTLR